MCKGYVSLRVADVIKVLTFEVDLEEILLVELATVVPDHGRTNPFPRRTDVRLRSGLIL